MAILDNLGNLLRRGLDTFRDLPRLETSNSQQAAAPVRPAPAAVEMSDWAFAWIDGEDIESTGFPYRANEWFPLAQMRTPETAHFRVMAGEKRLRVYLKGQQTVAGQNLGAPQARTVNLPYLIQSAQKAPTLPSAYHPDVAVWAQVGGVWQRLTITNVNYAGGQVTFTEPAGVSDTIEIYYTHADGQFRFRVARDAGGIDDSVATVFNQSFGTMHSVDQNNLETMLAWPQQVELVPGTRLVLEVRTTQVPMVWNDRAGHYVHIAALARRVQVLDKGKINRLAELENRAGL